MEELGSLLQKTKRENVIKHRICKSISAEDYKGSASQHPGSDTSTLVVHRLMDNYFFFG